MDTLDENKEGDKGVAEQLFNEMVAGKYRGMTLIEHLHKGVLMGCLTHLSLTGDKEILDDPNWGRHPLLTSTWAAFIIANPFLQYIDLTHTGLSNNGIFYFLVELSYHDFTAELNGPKYLKQLAIGPPVKYSTEKCGFEFDELWPTTSRALKELFLQTSTLELVCMLHAPAEAVSDCNGHKLCKEVWTSLSSDNTADLVPYGESPCTVMRTRRGRTAVVQQHRNKLTFSDKMLPGTWVAAYTTASNESFAELASTHCPGTEFDIEEQPSITRQRVPDDRSPGSPSDSRPAFDFIDQPELEYPDLIHDVTKFDSEGELLTKSKPDRPAKPKAVRIFGLFEEKRGRKDNASSPKPRKTVRRSPSGTAQGRNKSGTLHQPLPISKARRLKQTRLVSRGTHRKKHRQDEAAAARRMYRQLWGVDWSPRRAPRQKKSSSTRMHHIRRLNSSGFIGSPVHEFRGQGGVITLTGDDTDTSGGYETPAMLPSPRSYDNNSREPVEVSDTDSDASNHLYGVLVRDRRPGALKALGYLSDHHIDREEALLPAVSDRGYHTDAPAALKPCKTNRRNTSAPRKRGKDRKRRPLFHRTPSPQLTAALHSDTSPGSSISLPAPVHHGLLGKRGGESSRKLKGRQVNGAEPVDGSPDLEGDIPHMELAEAPRLTGAQRRRLRRMQEDQRMQQEDPEGWQRLQQARLSLMPYGWDKYDLPPLVRPL